jgi:hypothetical protein
MMKTKLRKKLLDILINCFDKEDLRTIAFIMGGVGVYDDLEGENRKAKSISLLEFLEHRGQVGGLIEYIEESRPDIEPSRYNIEPKPELPSPVGLENCWVVVVRLSNLEEALEMIKVLESSIGKPNGDKLTGDNRQLISEGIHQIALQLK